MSAIFAQLKGQLVVSCQASPGDPLEDTDAICRMALAAIGGGAAGLRLNSPEHIAAIRRHTDLPIIGIQKYYGPAGLRITPDFASACALARAGASIIALDCTDRVWPDGEPWPQIIQMIREQLHLPVMADVATFDEARAAVAAGADCVGTTLNGYTENTRGNDSFSWSLLARLARDLRVPIMAEGHISTPAEARRAIDGGAWCVIVGSAITRPGVIAQNFASVLAQSAPATPAVGVDIGGTSIKAALVAPDGTVSLAEQVPTDASKGRAAIASGLVQVVERVVDAAHRRRIEPSGIGIATAGAVDERDGSIFAATDNLPGWAGFPLRAFAEERFGLPVHVVNDAQAAVLSELHFGLGSGLSDFIAITIGTGIGGGIVSGGKLLRGQHGFAGSIGHTVIHAGGRPCNCGRNGCLESYVSTAALLREYREHGGMLGVDTDANLALKINESARKGDPAAVAAYAALSDYLAEGLANLFNLLDPEVVLLSGGLIEGCDGFVSNVQDRVEKLIHFGDKRKPQIRSAQAGRFAGVQGAAALVFETHH
ncbi:MAG: putative N-acetylmannosamine-6-phosphate 2-epimerase [Terracidiphilus sp.]|nr:putative N-acetylmannosamine-6-phosphate 2-epimerase [Terracidiphilus sp.]